MNHHSKYLSAALSISLTVSLFGCGPFRPVELDRSAIQGRKIIAFAGCDQRKHYMVIDSGKFWGAMIGTAAMGATAGSGAADAYTAAHVSPDMTILDVAAERTGYNASREMERALQIALRNKGYTVLAFNAPHKAGMSDVNFSSDYSGAPPNADLIVDCIVLTDFGDDNAKEFAPVESLLVRVDDAKTGNELMMQKLYYAGSDDGKVESNVIIADRKYYLADGEALKARPELAIEGMRSGIPLLAERAASSLRQ